MNATESQTVMESLMASVAKGVRCENGVYTFDDPGIPLGVLRQIPIVQERNLLHSENWYDQYDWAKREDAPQERWLRFPVISSFRYVRELEELLASKEEVAYTRSVATLLVINALANGKQQLPDCYVRCVEFTSDGRRVFVRRFDTGEFVVVAFCGERFDDRLGLMSSVCPQKS